MIIRNHTTHDNSLMFVGFSKPLSAGISSEADGGVLVLWLCNINNNNFFLINYTNFPHF
jgi:hypothetical protein